MERGYAGAFRYPRPPSHRDSALALPLARGNPAPAGNGQCRHRIDRAPEGIAERGRRPLGLQPHLGDCVVQLQPRLEIAGATASRFPQARRLGNAGSPSAQSAGPVGIRVDIGAGLDSGRAWRRFARRHPYSRHQALSALRRLPSACPCGLRGVPGRAGWTRSSGLADRSGTTPGLKRPYESNLHSRTGCGSNGTGR